METKFYQVIDLRNRKAMIEYLTGHFRYNTMNSWNNSTSYANNLKVYSVIPRDKTNKVFELMETEGFYDSINDLIRDWNQEQGYYHQAGFNGRSGGYLVMYEGSVETKIIFNFDERTCQQYNNRDYADGYGWLSMEEAKKRGLYRKQIKKVGCYPGRSIDQDEDFEDWSNDQLKGRVKLVQSFDKLCDDIVAEVLYMAENCNVEEEEYTVTKTRKVLA